MKNNVINSMKKIIEMERLGGVKEIIVKDFKVQTAKDAGREKSQRVKESESQEVSGSLDDVSKNIERCQKCGLSQTRTRVVPGEGDPNAQLMFIGEAPGRDEDAQGRPFVGRAGQLLTKIIESIGLKRKDVFIANILKCRPPGNRNPLPTEVVKCSPYLLEQIKFIKPKVICALGKSAAQTLLNTEMAISRLRGEFHDYHGIKLMPTYHPAYLLRNSSGKKDVWEDMKKIAEELKIKIPGKNKSE